MEKTDKTTLADLSSGTKGIIVKISGHGGFRHRIIEMGFVRGEEVTVIKNAPLSDPIEYEVMKNRVSLRRSEAAQIEVMAYEGEGTPQSESFGTFEEDVRRKAAAKQHDLTIALVGNPNCGKTSFFNQVTGLHEKVGNYSGVTVDLKEGTLRHGDYTLHFIDLPGTYSITDYSPEEAYVRSFLMEHQPDLVLNIVDASNLERNLFLTSQLIDMNVRMVMALNMYDELTSTGATLDVQGLSEMLGFPIVPTVSSRGEGIDKVLDTLVNLYEDEKTLSKHIHINYGTDIEAAVDTLKKKLQTATSITDFYPVRYLALKLLEGDRQMTQKAQDALKNDAVVKEAAELRTAIEQEYHEDMPSIVAGAKYGFIRGALQETYQEGSNLKERLAYSVDRVLTNRWLGFPVLLFFMWLMFEATFTLGAYPQDWIQAGVDALGKWTASVMPPGMLTDLVVDGIIAGVGGVIVFLPNILILFFFISLLEDSGYMARAAFIMDKLMHRIGLHGKSFIPFLIGFGCGVPAIMATRTLESRKDRIVTVLTVPFMSCSARLPVYLLFVSAFFTANQGLILMSLYLVGIIVAILTAMLLTHTTFKKETTHFVMELPPYRLPTVRNTLIHMWEKAVYYLRRMATVILGASVIIWALGYFPQHSAEAEKYEAQLQQVQANTNLPAAERDSVVAALEGDIGAVQVENSYLGRLGHFIEPAVRPLGFDWKMGVSILTGISAKEIVVSSMGVLYHAGSDANEESESLKHNLQAQVYTSGPNIGQKVITPVVALSFMLFVLLYVPCIASVVAIRKEAGTRWMFFSVGYTIAVAWLVSFVVYQVGSAL